MGFGLSPGGSLSSLASLFVLIGLALPSGAAPVQDAPAAPRFEDEPEVFVPKTPRTAEDQARIEAVRDYVAARALEDRRQFREALALLEKALQKDPESVPILRRLSRISFAIGRLDQGIDYAKRVIEADPNDAATLRLLVSFYRDRKFDPAAAEALLQQVLANPKLNKQSAAYLLAQRDLGELYARQLGRPDQAADAFAIVLDQLDEKAANALTSAEIRLILGNEPAATYQLFGDALFLARRFDQAIRAYRRGLAYQPEDVELPLRLTEALFRAGQKAEALATLEPVLAGKPEAREPYELLSQILAGLDRKAEVIPRLEALLQDDPKNIPLKYVLADRYKEAGNLAKANELYEVLMKNQADPQGFAALAASLRKEKKYEDLIRLFETALGAPNGPDTIKPQIEALCLDPEAADAVLDAGLKLLEAEPPGLGRNGRNVLVYIANRAERPDKLIALERLTLKQNPTPLGYRELWMGLYRANRFDEAAEALNELLAKFPGEATTQIYNMLAQTLLRAGQIEPALEAALASLKLNPNDVDGLTLSAMAYSKLGKYELAIAQFQTILDRFGNNDDVARQARSGLSTVYVDMGELDKGEAELEILYQKDPEDPGINNDLGYLYADRGKNLEQAEAMIRKALDDEPENGAYLDSLGWVLYRQGRIQEAVEPLEKAAKIATTDATIFDHLGDVYYRLQDFAKARANWEKAEELAARQKPPEKRLAEIRKKLEALKKQPAGAKASADNP